MLIFPTEKDWRLLQRIAAQRGLRLSYKRRPKNKTGFPFGRCDLRVAEHTRAVVADPCDAQDYTCYGLSFEEAQMVLSLPGECFRPALGSCEWMPADQHPGGFRAVI